MSTPGPNANPRITVFTFTPTAAQVGTFTGVKITASETGPNPASASTTFTIIVNNVNQPPVLDPISDQSVNENELLEFTVSGSDADGDALTFSASNLPDGATFDASSQTFSWTPTYEQSGDYPGVLFTVTSGSPAQSDSQTISITVGDVNRTPKLDPIGSQTATENTPFSLTVTGSDPDGDSIAFSASPLPTGASFDASLQTFSWTPDYDQAGTYTVKFTVTDDGDPVLSASEDVTITVGNVNRPPVLNPIGNQTAYKGEELTFVVTGSDPDGTNPPYGNVLTYSADPLPTGASFDEITQTFSWIPTQGDEGDHVVTFEVADDGSPPLSDSEEVTITVVNRPPEANAGPDQTVEQTSPAGAQVTLDGSASSDPDNDSLTYAWSWSGGSATGGSPIVSLPAGVTLVTLEVSDGIDTDTDTVEITVRDTIPPTIALQSRTPDPNGNVWNNSDVTVTWTCTDSGSGPVADEVSQTVSAEGIDQSAAGTCADNAGNTSSATETGINIDTTAPTASASASPEPNADGWNNTDVTVSFSGSDALSGIDFCSADVVLSSDGTGQSASGTCTDKAGNVSATATASGINIDQTAPTLTWNGGPANVGVYYFGFVPAAPTCTAVDSLSGPDTCVVTGYNTTVGSHEMTATAYDKAGNSKVESRTYTVSAWTLKGFYQPVDMGGVLNTVKNGSTVPLKFEVFAGPTELTDVGVVRSVTAAVVSCNSSTEDQIEELATTGGTVLRYDTTGGQFINNWATPKKAGSCYRVTMTTQDGSAISALFKLK